MNTESNSLNHFLAFSSKAIPEFIDSLDYNALRKAADIIDDSMKAGGRIHITGIGKPAHIAGYLASLMSSTGTPTYFLHGTEAVHGSLGQLKKGDVVICISNSGKTAEILATAQAIRNNGCQIISVTSDAGSPLAQLAEVHLYAGVPEEGGPLNRAPRLSILAETLVIQSLSIILQEERNITPRQYVTWHPGGSLGKLRDNET